MGDKIREMGDRIKSTSENKFAFELIYHKKTKHVIPHPDRTIDACTNYTFHVGVYLVFHGISDTERLERALDLIQNYK